MGLAGCPAQCGCVGSGLLLYCYTTFSRCCQHPHDPRWLVTMSVIQVEGWREVGKAIPPLFQDKTQMLRTWLLLTSCRELDHMATLNCKAGSTTMHPAENSVITEKEKNRYRETTRNLCHTVSHNRCSTNIC